MHFLPFIDLNGYAVDDKKRLHQALSAYFQSPRLKPFYDALFRNGTKEQKRELKCLTEQFITELLQARDRINTQKYLEWMTLWEELSNALLQNNKNPLKQQKTIEEKHLPAFYDAHIRKIIHDKQNQLDVIENKLKEYSYSIVDKEHSMAINCLDSTRIVSFSEYLDEVWELSTHKQANFNPTFLQWKHYLSYIREKIRPFANMHLYTENRAQACDLLDSITGMIQRMAQTEQRLIDASNTIFELKEAISNNHSEYLKNFAKISIYKNHPNKKERYESIAFNLKLERQDLEDALIEAQAELPAPEELCCTPTGLLKTDSDIYKMCENHINYWIRSYSEFFKRQNDMILLEQHAKNESHSYKDILHRYISENELQELKKLKQFSQFAGSLEREKWFFKPGACPGNGVSHDFVCDIYLKTGSINLFDKLACPAGERTTIIFKENEPHCIGFHEDALPFLNRMIDNVIIYRRIGNMRKKTLEIPFRKDPLIDDVPALTVMFNTMNMASITPEPSSFNRQKYKKN